MALSLIVGVTPREPRFARRPSFCVTMKIVPVLFVASAAANLAFAALLISRPTAAGSFLRSAFSRAEPAARPAVNTTKANRVAAPATAKLPTWSAPLEGIDWSNLQVADYSAIGAHLAAMGVPAENVRAITAMLVHVHYNQRRRALRAGPDPSEYWRNPVRRTDPMDLAADRELQREQNKVLREVVGTDYDFSDDDGAQRRRFGDLAEDKVAKLKKIFADYSDLEEQLFADNADRNSPTSRARSALLAKEKRADIERLLTPDELLDYDLRNSQGANRLRNKLGAFQATEAEFRSLYPAFKAVADAETQMQGGAPGRANFAEMRRIRETAEQQLDAELKRVLGDARFDQLKEANDHGLQQTRELIASLRLPPTSITDVVAIQKEFQPRFQAIERDRDLTANQRDAQLDALATEAKTRLTRVLGADGFEAYKRRGGTWLGAALNRPFPGR
jgi:hypothetical protein